VFILGITESDGLALAMLLVMSLSFSVIATLLYCMFRNRSKRDPEVDRLLEELEDKQSPADPARAGSGKEQPKEPCERESEWWKDDSTP